MRSALGQVSHALLFDQVTVASQHLHEARDDLFEYAPYLGGGRRARLTENRLARAKWLSGSRHSFHVRIQVAINPVSFL